MYLQFHTLKVNHADWEMGKNQTWKQTVGHVCQCKGTKCYLKWRITVYNSGSQTFMVCGLLLETLNTCGLLPYNKTLSVFYS